MAEQLAFSSLLAEADQQRQAALDRHRARVQALFDGLAEDDKDHLAEMFATYEWDTCAALSAATNDWGIRNAAAKAS